MSDQPMERIRVAMFLARDRAGRVYELRERCESITVRTRGADGNGGGNGVGNGVGECEAITASAITTADGQRVRCLRHPRYIIESTGVELIAENTVFADSELA